MEEWKHEKMSQISLENFFYAIYTSNDAKKGGKNRRNLCELLKQLIFKSLSAPLTRK